MKSPLLFLKKWTATPVKKRVIKGKVVARAKVFQRYARIGEHTFAIGTVSYFQTKKKKNDNLNEETYLNLKRAYGEESKWNSKRVGKSMVVEGPWTKGNRYIRYYITELPDSISISTAIFRIGYADSVGPESLIVQREMARTAGEKKHFSFFDYISPISSAHAQFGGWPSGGPGSGNPLDFSDVTNSMDELNNNFDQISSQLSQTNSHLGDANVNWGDTNVQIGDANQNWSNSNTQMENANQNWSNSNTQMENANQNWGNTNVQIGNANQNWADSNVQMGNANENWAETNRQYARTNDIAEKMLDPKHMFTLQQPLLRERYLVLLLPI